MDAPSEVLRGRIRRALWQQLESWQQAGVQQWGRGRSCPPAAAAPQDNAPASATPPASSDSLTPTTPLPSMHRSLFSGDPVPRLSLPDKQTQLQSLCEAVRGCRLCSELVANRTQTVFGTGDPQTRLCFFGEAPGADEDRQGEPFVGRAGQLLNKILEACTLQRQQVYILNVLKCRPPQNRTPTAEEADNCRPFFERQLEIIRPDYICCLGSVAATALLASKSSLGRLRGRLHPWRWAQVLVTYHPAYLLRNPAAKRQVWEDMQLLMREMGIVIPPR